MNDYSIISKQQFLTKEIIKKGYDAQEFSTFLTEQKGEERIDLEYWTMEDLRHAVDSFKEEKMIKDIEKSKEILNKRRHSSADNTKNRKRNNNKADLFGKTISFKNNENNEISKGKHLFKDFFEINNNNQENLGQKDDNENQFKIKCIKLEENDITNREDLWIDIILPDKNRTKILSNISELIIETNPIGFRSIRKIYDFVFLHKKLALINSEVYNPCLYINKSENNEEISKESIIYLNLFINTLIKNSYFRTLPIVYDFLTKEQKEWEKIKHEIYDKIKEINKADKIPNLNGYFNLEMNAGDDEKSLNINEELALKIEVFNKLNKNIDELLKMNKKMNLILKTISETFGELKNRYINSPDTTNLFAYLEIITKIWGDGYITQKEYIINEFIYFFRYMNMENKFFMNYYDNFKQCYYNFKSKFDKMSKILYPSEKDKKILKNLQREFSFKSNNVKDEYQKLNEIQGKRIEYKLNKISNNKKVLFKEVENIQGLLNFVNKKQVKSTENIKLKDNEIIINEMEKNIKINKEINDLNVENNFEYKK